MDPVTILSLVCNICQLCEYGAAALVTAKKVYDSETGLTDQHEKLQSSTKSLGELMGRLQLLTQSSIGSFPNQIEDGENLHVLASKCQEISGEILTLLEKIRGKKRHSFADALGVVVKGGRNKGRIAKLQEELSRVQSQVQLQLTEVLRIETLQRLEVLIKARKSDASELASLRDNIQTLRAGVPVEYMSSEVLSQLLHLLALSTNGIDRKCRDCILEGVSFPNMNKRYDDADTAHHATFTWILEDDAVDEEYYDTVPDPVKEDKEKRLPTERDIHGSIRHKFRSWLARGKGVYQIYAKPGAGKSTMMKFICNSDEAKKLLRLWSGDRTLITARFFFWKQESRMQRSLDGMIRSLLHAILSQAPELIEGVFPVQWRSLKSAPWHAILVPEISNADARIAFENLLSHANTKVFSAYSVCVFLDGLDEFEGKKGSAELINFIQNMALLSDHIKICVSSRLMNSLAPFDVAYPQQRMCLNTLTEADIRRVVRDTLNDHPRFREMRLEGNSACDDLIAAVVGKAEGVFLWVTLILKILCQGLTDEDSISDLWEKLESYPDDLDEFLQQIIKSIPTENRKLAYRTFAVASMLSETDNNMRLFDYSFLEEYNSNSSFAVIMPMDNGLSTHEVDIRLARTRKRLIAHCKDLLQVDDEGHGIQSPTVSFIHRSVREIFLQDEVKTHMAKHLKAFNVLDAILQITLAGTKSEPEIRFTVETTQQKRQSLRDLFGFISRFQDQCNDSTWTSLDHIAAAILHRQGVFAGSFHEVSWSKYQVSLWYASRPAFGRRFVVSLVHFAAEMHFDAYLKWTVKKIPDFAEHHEAGTELLVCYVVQHPFGRWSAEGQLWVESMFQKGLSANCPLYSSVAAYSVSKRSPRLDQRLVWFWLLENLVRYPDHRNSEIWQVIEIFLQYGADCSSVMKLGTEFGTYPAEKRLRWAGTTITLHEGISVMSEVLKNRAPNTVRFQDFVDFWAPPNATALKKLIVRNQTREAESPSVVTLSIQDFEHRWNTSSDLYSVVFQMREANWEVSPPTRLELTEGVGS